MTNSPAAEPSILASVDGRMGRILLNRPKALNALDLPMIEAMTAALTAWRDDPAVDIVVIDSASERAFCAGGDIRAIRHHATAGEAAAVERFFATEYALNAQIAEYPKPYIALIDGICMGGGIGISVHGQVRITSEHGLFAMPETAIGMFPDVGATYFLPRLHGAMGTYLGLTGQRLTGADAVHAGLATHFVPRATFPALRAALAERGASAVSEFAQPLPAFTLAEHTAAIGRCFAATTLGEIEANLKAAASDWAQATLATLLAMSPSALCWSLAAIRRGAGLKLRDALDAELRLTRHVSIHPDFAEGVRAMVVDKDRQPKWSPVTLAEVDAGAIAAMLA